MKPKTKQGSSHILGKCKAKQEQTFLGVGLHKRAFPLPMLCFSVEHAHRNAFTDTHAHIHRYADTQTYRHMKVDMSIQTEPTELLTKGQFHLK